MRRATDLSVWLADLTYTQQTIAADVIPNAIGGTATYAETRLALPEPIRLFKYPEKLAAALAGDAPAVIGFSNYVWNFSLSCAFARLIKARFPRTVTVFGGPNYPVDVGEQRALLSAHPEIDLYIVKEGEVAFAELLLALAESGGNLEAVKALGLGSVHAIEPDGGFRAAATLARLQDLTEIPSPYVAGRLDEFFDGLLLPIVQTNRGCPFSCTFCVEGVGYYNKVRRNAAEKVRAELDYIGAKMQKVREAGGRNDLFIADSNFAMYREDIDTCRELARTREVYGWPEYINVATGKNQKESVLEASRLIEGAMRLSGSVQSLDPTVLENIKRANISAEGLMDLALSADEIGANSYSEIILGLPAESKESHWRTVRTIMDAGFNNIYLFQLMLLPGTDLATPETRAKFAMQSRFRVLPRCYGHFEVLSERLVAAEIEEICVASDSLGFEDYLVCRRLHLIITIFYNDGVFATLVTLLRALGVSLFRWMELIAETPPPGAGLKALFESFEKATRDELWESREPLEAFIQQPGIVEKFIDGELGNNLLFTHKTMALTGHADELAALARQSIHACLAEAGKDDDEVLAFVDDALAYHVNRMSGIFHDRDRDWRAVLEYDIPAFEQARQPGAIADYRLDRPRQYDFVMDDGVRELVDRYLAIYGDSTVGIGRIISKVYVSKLFRHAAQAGAAPAGATSEQRIRIAGLQN